MSVILIVLITLKFFSFDRSPVISIYFVSIWNSAPFGKRKVIEPGAEKTADVNAPLTPSLNSKWPNNSNGNSIGPYMWKFVIGGWCDVYSIYKVPPFYVFLQLVSPKIGFKGLLSPLFKTPTWIAARWATVIYLSRSTGLSRRSFSFKRRSTPSRKLNSYLMQSRYV